jgi:hypothetical protein
MVQTRKIRVNKISTKSVQIMLKTNIPPNPNATEEEAKQNEFVPFTSGMLYHPFLAKVGKLDKNPFLCTNYIYPSTELNNFRYDQRVRFFFDKSYFKRKMEGWLSQGILKDNAITPKEPGNFILSDKWNVAILSNLNKMLELIFPTLFPRPGNVFDSYTTYFNPSFLPDGKSIFSFKSIIPEQISKYMGNAAPALASYYSYLNIGGKRYTITKVVLLNDILNHPKYNTLIEDFENFNIWRDSQRKGIEINIDTTSERLKESNYFLSNLEFERIRDNIEKEKKAPSDSRVIINTNIQERLDTVRSIIGYITSYNEHRKYPKENIESIINEINNLDEAIKNLTSLKVLFDIKVQNQIRVVKEIVKEIEGFQILKNSFFGPAINLRIDEQSGPVKQILETKYKEYREFVKKIENYVSPNRETQNARLYQLFVDYLKNQNQDLEAYMREFSNFPSEIQFGFLNESIEESIKEMDENKKKSITDKFEKIRSEFNIQLNRLTGEDSENVTLSDMKTKLEDMKTTTKDKEKEESLERLLARIKEQIEIEDSEKENKKDRTVESDIQAIMNTSVDLIPNNDVYEIYLNMSLIGGELNYSNIRNIYCKYKGESLNKQYQNLKNRMTYKSWLVMSDVFYDANNPRPKVGGGTFRNKYLNSRITRKRR